MKIGIIDYGVGNLGSIMNTLNLLGCNSFISDSPNQLKTADGLILPGDGAAGEGMRNLKKTKLDMFIVDQIKEKRPFFGICLGMQILLSKSEEGNVDCLNILDGVVEKINTSKKLPHIGWNQISIKKKSKIMKNIADKSLFYFINSYICKPVDASVTVGETEYDEIFCSVFEKETIFGIQFHPEKSGDVGKQMLKNFLELC